MFLSYRKEFLKLTVNEIRVSLRKYKKETKTEIETETVIPKVKPCHKGVHKQLQRGFYWRDITYLEYDLGSFRWSSYCLLEDSWFYKFISFFFFMLSLFGLWDIAQRTLSFMDFRIYLLKYFCVVNDFSSLSKIYC